MKTKQFAELWVQVESMPDNEVEAIAAIIDELHRARGLYPEWPTDAVHAAAVMAEEAGETVKAALDFHYKGEQPLHKQHMKDEATQTGAMAIRVLLGVENYAVNR